MWSLKDKFAKIGALGKKLTEVDSIRDRLSGISARCTAIFSPNSSFKTSRFTREEKASGKSAGNTVYSWVEANRTGKNEYTLQQIDETRYEQSDIASSETRREITALIVDGRSTFSKDELRSILNEFEKDYKKQGFVREQNQPFRAQHYSWIREPAEKKSISRPKREPI